MSYHQHGVRRAAPNGADGFGPVAQGERSCRAVRGKMVPAVVSLKRKPFCHSIITAKRYRRLAPCWPPMNPNINLFLPVAGYWLAVILFLWHPPSAFFFLAVAPLLVAAAVVAVIAHRNEGRVCRRP